VMTQLSIDSGSVLFSKLSWTLHKKVMYRIQYRQNLTLQCRPNK
jgi:hypothetical protein